MFCTHLHNFPATLEHKTPGLRERYPVNSNIQHKTG